MLVLSRKIGEVVTIGTAVKITVLSYDRGVVRLGIEAPKDIPVHRKEVYDRIIELNKRSSKTDKEALKEALSLFEIGVEKEKEIIGGGDELLPVKRVSGKNEETEK